jgi:hypothetical protein
VFKSTLRQEHGITNTEHNQFLGLFGWTPEEYEDGEKVEFFHHTFIKRAKVIFEQDNIFLKIDN